MRTGGSEASQRQYEAFTQRTPRLRLAAGVEASKKGTKVDFKG
jgi:hypothetical protein